MDRLNARDFELPNEVSLHYFLYSIDLDSGKINWKREFHAGHPPGGRHRKNSFCSETPVTDGSRVYVYINNLGLFAYDLDGNQVWNTPLENFPTILDFGTASSPTLVNDLVIIVNDNEKQQFIAAFDKNTGKQVWRTNRSIHVQGSDRQTGWSSPYIWKNSAAHRNRHHRPRPRHQLRSRRQGTVAPRRDVRHAHPESFRLRRPFVSQRRDR